MLGAPLPHRIPRDLATNLRRRNIRPSRWLLTVSVQKQTMHLWESLWHRSPDRFPPPQFTRRRSYLISSSRFGEGQQENSFKTPLGLHRVARKIGAGHPSGTVFQYRRPIGYTWQGYPEATIVHRILWLEGLESGHNKGGSVDTFQRYVYIHGFGDETTLGRPQSHGCIHMAATDLIPLFDQLPVGSMVWIDKF